MSLTLGTIEIITPVIGINSNNYTIGDQTWISSASTTYQPQHFSAYNAFDNSTSTFWHSTIGNYTLGLYNKSVSTTIVDIGNVLGEWIQIKVPYSFILTEYTLIQRNNVGPRMPRVFHIVGSNDGTTWFPVNYQNYENNSIGYSIVTNTVNNTKFYSYYRLVVNAVYEDGDCVNLSEWKMSGMKIATANELRLADYTIQQLKENQYTANEILTAGYSANELRLASYTAIQLKNAGYSNKQIIEGKYNNFQLKNARIKTAYELRKMGYTAYQMMNEGYSGQIFKTLKFTPTELLDPEVPPSEMRKYGYSIADMKRAGITVGQLLESGFELKRIITAGFGLEEILIGRVTIDDIKKIKVPTIKILYSPIQLLNAGLDVTYLRRVGFTSDELRQVGITAKQLRLGGYDPIQVYNAGYSLSEMKDAGYFAYELAHFGYTFSDLVNAGYSGDELKTAGYLTFTNIIVLGYTSISGVVNFMATNNSTAYSNGGVIIAGGLGVAKDVYLNELYSKLQINLDVSGQIVHDGTNLKLIHLMENGTIRFTVKENGQISLIATQSGNVELQFLNNSIQVNYNKVNIPCTTLATSVTTGALTSVGGISSENNIYGQNYIACDASGIEVMRLSSSSSSIGLVTNSQSGLILSNANLNIGKNTSHFGTRTLAEPSANLKINGSTGTAFSFEKQQLNSQTVTTDMTISSSGIINVSNDTQSSGTNVGSLQVNGGAGIEKNVNVGGSLAVWDVLNSGTVQQTGTTIGFSSGDGSSPMPSATSALFSSAPTFGTTMSNADLHTHIYNYANQSTQKTILAQTFSVTSAYLQVTNVYIGAGYPIFYAIHLQKDQVIKGLLFFFVAMASDNCYGAIYAKGYQPMRLAYTGNTPLSVVQGFNYLPLETHWTVPATDIYYIGQLVTRGTPYILCVGSNSFLHYSTGNPATATLSKTTQYYGSGTTTSLPSQITSTPGLTASNFLCYSGVYG
jgi:hypothetical protein